MLGNLLPALAAVLDVDCTVCTPLTPTANFHAMLNIALQRRDLGVDFAPSFMRAEFHTRWFDDAGWSGC